jgi:hypothetical protein
MQAAADKTNTKAMDGHVCIFPGTEQMYINT